MNDIQPARMPQLARPPKPDGHNSHVEHQLRRSAILQILEIDHEAGVLVEITRYKNGQVLNSYCRRLPIGASFEFEIAMNFNFEEAWKESS